MINKKTVAYWSICSLVLAIVIHYLDGMPIIYDWAGTLTGFFLGILLLIIASIILATLIAAYPFKSNKTPNGTKIKPYLPIATVILSLASIIAFLVTRPSYDIEPATSAACAKVQDGVFLLEDYIIERKGNLQTETDRITGEKGRYIVKWIKDCEFELTNQGDKNDVTKIKIVDVTNKGYECIASSNQRTTSHYLEFYNEGD